MDPDVKVSSSWKDAPWVAIDVETTGLDWFSEAIVEIGFCFVDGDRLSGSLSWLLNSGIPFREGAQRTHGIAMQDVANAPSFADLASHFATLLDERLPVGYNAPFDRRFLMAAARRSGCLPLLAVPALRDDIEWIDPLVWSRALYARKSHKLASVCADMGIALSGAHRAEHDAEATAHVLLEMAYRLPDDYASLVRLQRMLYARQQIAYIEGRYEPEKERE